MAQATATFTIYGYPNGIDETGRRQIVTGNVSISASPATYATGGLPLSFAIEDVKGDPTKPQGVSIYSVSGSGYTYAYNKSTGKVQIFVQASAAGDAQAEMANAAAIPAGVSGDTIECSAEFIRS